MKYRYIEFERAKMSYIYFLVQFFSPFCKFLALKLPWSAIKFWSTLLHMAL